LLTAGTIVRTKDILITSDLETSGITALWVVFGNDALFFCLSGFPGIVTVGCVAKFGRLKTVERCDYRLKASPVSKRKWQRNFTCETWNLLGFILFSTEFFEPPTAINTMHCNTIATVAIDTLIASYYGQEILRI
jgi:hypothetical protein